MLTRSTPTLVPEDIGVEVGLFGVEPDGVETPVGLTLEERMDRMDDDPDGHGPASGTPVDAAD